MISQAPQIPLPIRREDFATWANWLRRPETDAMEQWLSGSADKIQSAFLCGGGGVGKSHALQACCEALNQEARYIPLNDLRVFPPDQVLAGIEGTPLVAIDDVDAVESEPVWHEGLFAAFNRCQEAGVCLLMSAQRAPKHLAQLLPDLQSRLSSLPVFQLPRFSEEHIAALLRLRAGAAGMHLNDEVVHYVMLRLARNPRAVITFVEQLDQLSLAASRAVTIPFVRDSGLLNRAEAE